jgi:hypothetical protein
MSGVEIRDQRFATLVGRLAHVRETPQRLHFHGRRAVAPPRPLPVVQRYAGRSFAPLEPTARRRYCKVPEVTANFCWGDDDLKSLFITASTSVYRMRLNSPGLAQLR